MAQGVTSDVYKYVSHWLQEKGLPNTPEKWNKAHAAYTKETKLDPAQVRVNAITQSREYPVIDTKNNNSLGYLNAQDLNAANAKEPGRYVPAGEGAKATTREALIEDIRGGIQQVRASLQNPKMPEFTPAMRTEISLAMRTSDPRSAISTLVNSVGAQSLTPEQQDYLINMSVLNEQAMAMRSVLGAGQGAEDMRAAILRTVPGPMTPNKAYGLQQLATAEKTLDRVLRGVPNVPLRDTTQGQQTPTPGAKKNPFRP